MWQTATPDRVRYRERFVIGKIHENLGYEVIDRELDYVHSSGKKYSIEVGDLYDAQNERVVVVKIGDPHDFGYAFDQAFAVLSLLEGKKYVAANARTYQVKTLEVLLVFQTQRELRSAKDTKSIIFEIKINELRKLAQDKGVNLKISYSTIL